MGAVAVNTATTTCPPLDSPHYRTLTLTTLPHTPWPRTNNHPAHTPFLIQLICCSHPTAPPGPTPYPSPVIKPSTAGFRPVYLPYLQCLHLSRLIVSTYRLVTQKFSISPRPLYILSPFEPLWQADYLPMYRSKTERAPLSLLCQQPACFRPPMASTSGRLPAHHR